MTEIQKFKEYPINETKKDINWDDIERDVNSLKKELYKKYKAMSSNAITIKASKEISKEYKISFKEILKRYKPDNNIFKDKSWDKEGNLK